MSAKKQPTRIMKETRIVSEPLIIEGKRVALLKKSTEPKAFPHLHQVQGDHLGLNRPYQQKFGRGMGPLPQLEKVVKQVPVKNSKLQQKLEKFLPHISRKEQQNGHQTQQKFGRGMGPLPQLEKVVKQVSVNNTKLQQKSEKFPPQISKKGQQNGHQIQQKFGRGMGPLPQLEKVVKQVSVNNTKLQQKSEKFLPQISKKGQQNGHQTQQEARQRAPQFPTRCSSSDKKLTEPLDTRSLSSKMEKERSHEELSLPMSPTEALMHFQDHLTKFEQEEILDYTEIWYLGLNTKEIEGLQGTPQNTNYDDENGSYITMLHDHIAYRFEVLEFIGSGSFGQVLKCLDHKTKELVAIKLITSEKRFQLQAKTELKILDVVRNKDRENCHNVVHMKEHFYFRKHLCISFELLGMNLYQFIVWNGFQGFSQALVRRMTCSLLKSLQMLQREKIIHCDLKPENILLQPHSDGNVKLADFGSSCFEDQELYDYMQTRYYRAPEVIMGNTYSTAIDMWSLGCILAELFTGTPLFEGESEEEQLACIMEVLGIPPNHLLESAPKRKSFFDSKGDPRIIIDSEGQKRQPNSKDLANLLKTDDPLFLDFLKRCLAWDPSMRMTPDEAMRHEWIQEPLKYMVRPMTRYIRKRVENPTGLHNEQARHRATNDRSENVVV